MLRKSKLAALAALAAAAAALFGACRADDVAVNPQASGGASQAASKNASSAQPAPSVVAQAPAEEARRVTVEELRKMLDEGKAVVYDTRPKAAYEQEHIKGAVSMPSNEVASRSGELAKGKSLVFYCT
jgi:3-mercaptopyruvate sulfurtransferase SseA